MAAGGSGVGVCACKFEKDAVIPAIVEAFEAVGKGEAREGVDLVNVALDEYLEGIGHVHGRTFEVAIS